MGSLALAAYETRVLALVDDAAQARYTTAQVDAAIRQALRLYSLHRPLIQTYSLDTDGNGTIECPDDLVATKIIAVELYDADIDSIRPLTFYAYYKDESWWIQTVGETIASGEVLTLTYSSDHTIDNLDNASGTTVPPEDEELICIGAAGYAQLQRASSRLESVNLNDDTIQRMLAIGQANVDFFLNNIYSQATAGFASLPAIPTDGF